MFSFLLYFLCEVTVDNYVEEIRKNVQFTAAPSVVANYTFVK